MKQTMKRMMINVRFMVQNYYSRDPAWLPTLCASSGSVHFNLSTASEFLAVPSRSGQSGGGPPPLEKLWLPTVHPGWMMFYLTPGCRTATFMYIK
jgi:hypothetical protein